MPQERERAYWFLLYRLLITLRCESGGGIFACLNPLQWRSSRRIFDLVDVFHNLPLYASRDWEDFDEEKFWKGIARYQSLHPNDKHDYRQIFERRLAGEDG